MARRTKAQWRELIENQKLSGLTAADFCRKHSVDAKYFSVRKRQLDADGGSFVQVMPSTAKQSTSTAKSIKLRMVELDVPPDALLDSLGLLLDARR